MTTQGRVAALPATKEWVHTPSMSEPGVTATKEFTDLGKRLDHYMRNGITPMTQAELARRSGVSQSTISRLLTSTKHTPDVKTIERLAAALGCEASDLMRSAYGGSLLPDEETPGDARPLPPRLAKLADLYYELNSDDRRALDDAFTVVHRYALTMLMRSRARTAGLAAAFVAEITQPFDTPE